MGVVSGVFYFGYRMLSAFHYGCAKRGKIEGVSIELTSVQRTLSGLIEAVYLADSREVGKSTKIIVELGYEEVKQGCGDLSFVVTAADSERAEEIRLKVFQRPSPGGTECVVAIRGTSLRSFADISDDYRITKQDLHNSPGYAHIKQIITGAIDEYEGKVRVAGHSLGAAYALLITRELALSDLVVETHLFNPPFVTLNVISSAPEAANKIKEEFAKLQASPWKPEFYLNAHDFICRTYIKYFENPGNFFVGMGPNSYHLIPAATVFINQKKPEVIDMLASHENNQWSENRMENLIKKDFSFGSDLWHKGDKFQADERAGPSVVNADLRIQPSLPGSNLNASSLTFNGCPNQDSGDASSFKPRLQLGVRYSGDPNSSSATHAAYPSGPSDSPTALPSTSLKPPSTCERAQTSANAPRSASSEPMTILSKMTDLERMTMLETPDASTARRGSSPSRASEDVSNSPAAVTAPQEQDDASGSNLNVLLLGETGVGKSTFINALYNYLTFESLDEARAEELQTLIYSEFSLPAEKYSTELINIRCGQPDDAEGGGNRTPGSSSTQSCRAYTFNFGENKTIRLIDTPGIGDTRGFAQDSLNMKGIVSYIARYKELHAICILLKPNLSRLTPALKYCILELLAHLHRDASSNILFCFTNSRSTMFRAGDTLELLTQLLSETPGLAAIKLNERSMYYFDSEAFRFLACLKSGFGFSDAETRMFDISWEESVKEASRLVEHISSLQPHDIQYTLSLNLVREMLGGVEEPLAKIAIAMQHNLEQVRKNTRDLIRLVRDGTNAELRGALRIKEEVLETVALGYRRTICNSSSCKGAVCHQPCSPAETFLGRGQVAFCGEREYQLFCEKFSLVSSACSACNCSRSSHIRVSTETRTVTRERDDEKIRKAIDDVEDKLEKESRLSQLLDEREKSIQEERKVVMNAAAIFAGFLVQNSFVIYHSATGEYFKSQIEMLKRASADEDTPEGKQRADKQIEELVAHLRTYERQVENFKARCGPSGFKDKVTIEHVTNELNKLYALRENGPELRALMEDIEREYINNTGAAGGRDEVVCNMTVPVAQAGASTPARPGAARRFLRIVKDHVTTSGHKGNDKRAPKP